MEENGLELLKVADKFNLHQLKGNFKSKEVIIFFSFLHTFF